MKSGANRAWPILALLALTTGCGPSPEAGGGEQPTRSVRVSPVVLEQGARELRISGVTRATRRATLAFLVSGTLVERPVDLGKRISEGQLVARLHNPALAPAVAAGEARVRELDARLEQLARDVVRAEDLRDRGLISEQELERTRTDQDATDAARDLASAQLAEASNRLDESRLVAPFGASVDAVYFEPGEYVAAGQPVIQLSGTGSLEVELEIPETLITKFGAGRQVALRLPFMEDRQVAGTVVHVGDAGGRAGGLFPVEIELSDVDDLRPGLTAELVLTLEGGPRMVIPLAAVLDPGTGRPRVFRIDDGCVEPVFVEIGQLFGDRVEVRGDLAATDEVVITGLASLTPGQAVEVLR